jgi:hypothetical protein
MNELFNMSILAESETGIVQILFFVVVIVGGFIINAVANARKKQQEQEEQERFAKLREEVDANKDDEWIEVDQPRPVPPPPPREEKSQPEVVSVGDFVKSEPIPVPIPVPVPVHLKSTTASQPSRRSSRPPKIARRGSKGKSRLATPRDHQDVHRTVPCDETADSIYKQQSGAAVRLDAATARQAIIFHEIFSPPKALRENCELWD